MPIVTSQGAQCDQIGGRRATPHAAPAHDMTFSAWIKARRKALGLTQAGLAERLDVDKQSVSNWECGRSTPWEKEQARIKTLLGDGPRQRIIDRILRDD